MDHVLQKPATGNLGHSSFQRYDFWNRLGDGNMAAKRPATGFAVFWAATTISEHSWARILPNFQKCGVKK